MTDKERVNILLVDDQPGKLLTYEAVLSVLDENLINATSATEALGYLLKHDFAVVLVDVCMPELDGYQLATMMRDHPRFQKTPIIFISAVYLSELDRLRGYESGAVDYVPVPVVPEILRAKVRVFVELHRKTRELERLNAELEERVAHRTAELSASNERLQKSEERLRLASAAAEFGTYECHLLEGIISCSRQMKDLLGDTHEGDLNLDRFFNLIHEADRAAVRRHLFDVSGEERRHEIEFRVFRNDGSIRWLLDRGQAFSDADAPAPTRVIGTVLDVTARKQVEERQLLLMAELDHRVKNILANVSAIAKLSSKRASSVEDFVQALDARIQAVSRAHSLLRRDSWIGIDIKSFIEEILEPFLNKQKDNVTIQCHAVNLSPKAAQSFALALHELATNAAKYGALSLPEGRVEIVCERMPEEGLGVVRLQWHERGGPKVVPPETEGFGITVIKLAAAELNAEITHAFRSEGVVFEMKGIIEQITKSTATPARILPVDAMSDNAAHATDQRKCRILLVEDEPVVALQIKTDLEAEGHKVIATARTVHQGIQLANSSEFDVAFLDVQLGDELSTPVADSLIERGIPFAFGSGFEDEKILPAHLRSIPRLMKPYKVEMVSRLLSRLTSQV